jgi:hypothetical protein
MQLDKGPFGVDAVEKLRRLSRWVPGSRFLAAGVEVTGTGGHHLSPPPCSAGRCRRQPSHASEVLDHIVQPIAELNALGGLGRPGGGWIGGRDDLWSLAFDLELLSAVEGFKYSRTARLGRSTAFQSIFSGSMP